MGIEKPGWKTTEFWLSLLTVLLVNTLPLLVLYNLVTQSQADAWVGLFLALINALGSGLTVGAYSLSRAKVKVG